MSQHGTYARYINDGCRCPECRAANTAHQRDYRHRAQNGAVRTYQRKKAASR